MVGVTEVLKANAQRSDSTVVSCEILPSVNYQSNSLPVRIYGIGLEVCTMKHIETQPKDHESDAE